MSQRLDREYLVFKKHFRDLRLHVDVGVRLYQAKRKQLDHKFYVVYEELATLVDPLEQHQLTLCEAAPSYDFINKDGTHVKGNGYRSLLHILKCIMEQLVLHLQKSARDRGSLLYSTLDDLSTLTADTRTVQGVEVMLRHAVILMKSSEPSSLVNDGVMAESLKRLVFTEDVARDAMYGRCLGFQYTTNLKPILQTLAIVMASYEQWYKADKGDPIKQLMKSVWKGSRYIQHPSQRGIKIADLTQDCSISFTKAFWSMMEQDYFKAALNMVSKSVEVSRSLEVPAKNIIIKSTSGEDITLTPPFSDMGYRPIPVTLISKQWRKNQPCSAYSRRRDPTEPSPYLIFHLHGGGFVAQSSRSHEFYLRWWSRELEAPILSVDYSLSPEAPFPRAVDECVTAYAWALQNLDTLGSTGEKILFVGDSAGGNLVITTAMKLKQLGIKLPHSIFPFYPTTIVRSSVTPSRFLSLLDPLLPIGVLYSCLEAYTGNVQSDEILEKRRDYRRRILTSRGYIVPSPHTTSGQISPSLSPTVEKKSFFRGRTKSLPQSKVPPPRPKPPRPPPPRMHSTLANGAEAEEGSESGQNDTTLTEVDLAEIADQSKETTEERNTNGSDEDNDSAIDESEMMSVAPFMSTSSSGAVRLGRRKPNDDELLTEQQIHDMIEEMVESLKDPEVTKDPFISPALADDKYLIGLPFMHIFVCGLDPLLDDGVAMAQRLKSVGQPVKLTVMETLPHGFLCLTGVDEIQTAQKIAIQQMKETLAN